MKEIPPQKARQGQKGRPVLIVLISSMIIVALVWFGAEIYGSYISESESIMDSNTTNEHSMPD
ncbi:hypothetical protein KHQ08_00890 (plasmid) [Pseudochrobactrum algeriensis]|uniref:Uncharacterized protein n=1 Tax=Pseudochrobactrum saccharolyticum TaxID=354352 RepID=A0A7W8EQ31_9HYPH|nr:MULTISPECIES: hypothetical protein [Pseudochrobactrum]MBX8785222.1 hypothetical protein [Ochrobactrum sp. GRS2]KAB0538215.1 hypothetical protein F7P81_10865 [Pseudochrobactrum saccharolyticum]MBB5091456.1 hypothetical protein [Pseudochrobactrum saccharolyticum]QVQ35482.1 hypothetical protein KHQ08_00890 [Pseudochrobactrum algeriensis]QVQ42098.1 hypothetical protein KHQ07_16760 [Pseudochrobactrum algeriensis]